MKSRHPQAHTSPIGSFPRVRGRFPGPPGLIYLCFLLGKNGRLVEPPPQLPDPPRFDMIFFFGGGKVAQTLDLRILAVQ